MTTEVNNEHRIYYKDKSLKAIYYTDEEGNRHGKYVEYAQNSDRIILEELYSSGQIKERTTYFDEEKKDNMSRTEYHVSKDTFKEGVIVSRSLLYHKNYYINETPKYEECCSMTFVDGQLHHLKTNYIDMYYKNGKEYDGTYYESHISGLAHDYTVYTSQRQFKDGKPHGEWINTECDKDSYKYRKREIVNYMDGILHGNYECVNECENRIGCYTQGKFTGTDKKQNGDVESWKNGELICTEKLKHNSNGEPTDGYIIYTNGTCTEYKDGKVIKQYEQKNGKKDGVYKEFDRDRGWLIMEANYKQGKLNGTCTEYYSDGTVASKHFYIKGKNKDIFKEAAIKNVNSTNEVAPKISKLQKLELGVIQALRNLRHKGK